MNIYKKVEKLEKTISDLEKENSELKLGNKGLLSRIDKLESENKHLTNLVNAKDKKENEFEKITYEAYQIQGFYKDLIECLKDTQKEMKKYT